MYSQKCSDFFFNYKNKKIEKLIIFNPNTIPSAEEVAENVEFRIKG